MLNAYDAGLLGAGCCVHKLLIRNCTNNGRANIVDVLWMSMTTEKEPLHSMRLQVTPNPLNG